MVLVVDNDVDVIMKLRAMRSLASVSVQLAELEYSVNDVCSYTA